MNSRILCKIEYKKKKKTKSYISRICLSQKNIHSGNNSVFSSVSPIRHFKLLICSYIIKLLLIFFSKKQNKRILKSNQLTAHWDASHNQNDYRIESVATESIRFSIRRIPSTGDQEEIVYKSMDNADLYCEVWL